MEKGPTLAPRQKRGRSWVVIEEISFQTMTEKVYKKLAGPKIIFWTKFPQNHRPWSIQNSTWDAEISDHIISLKLGFFSKRKHDPKGWVDAHLRKNHFKVGYTHEEVPEDSIYQGVDSFF